MVRTADRDVRQIHLHRSGPGHRGPFPVGVPDQGVHLPQGRKGGGQGVHIGPGTHPGAAGNKGLDQPGGIVVGDREPFPPSGRRGGLLLIRLLQQTAQLPLDREPGSGEIADPDPGVRAGKIAEQAVGVGKGAEAEIQEATDPGDLHVIGRDVSLRRQQGDVGAIIRDLGEEGIHPPQALVHLGVVQLQDLPGLPPGVLPQGPAQEKGMGQDHRSLDGHQHRQGCRQPFPEGIGPGWHLMFILHLRIFHRSVIKIQFFSSRSII